MANWRNRIVERRVMKVSDIALNKFNPKIHPGDQKERLRAVLDKFGRVDDFTSYSDDPVWGFRRKPCPDCNGKKTIPMEIK